MEFTLDGLPLTVHAPENVSLLEVLRAVTSMKDRCAPEGSCCACIVMVGGQAVVSCAKHPAARFGGRHITTQEGLTPDQRAGWSHDFVAAGA